MLQASENPQTQETAAIMGKHISRMESYVSSMSNLRRMEDAQPDNLISNAVRYARTAVTISFALRDNGLLLSVSDDGKGFDKNGLQKATSPYYTEESNHSEHFGLGLYICKLLCEHHNGYLKIENTASGAKVSAYFKSPAL